MTIKQLTLPEIEVLKAKARAIRDQILTAVRDNVEGTDWVNLSYQASRIETWVRIQEGSNDQLKHHLESQPQPSLTRTTQTPNSQNTSNSQAEGTTGPRPKRQYYLPPSDRPDHETRRAYEAINQRSQQLKTFKPLPAKIKWR